MAKVLSTLQSLAAFALLGAALLLSLPGVEAVRADEALAGASPEGPMCSAEPGGRAAEMAALAEIEAALARARAEQQREWAAKGWGPKEAAEAGEVVVLNGRGYNYGPSAAPPR